MIIIDPYRGGLDSGYIDNNIVEKDFNLMISKYINNRLNELGIQSILTRDNDKSLSDEERASIINGYNGIAISNRLNYGDDNGVEIVYSLKNTNTIPNMLETSFNDRDIFVNKVYQRRDENDTSKDYDNLLKNTNTETIIINYGYINNNDDINNVLNNYEKYAESVIKAIADYYGVEYTKTFDNEYIVKKGDSLWSIATKYGITVNDLKEKNNLKTNLINVGQVLKIPEVSTENSYIVKKGDSLWSISKKFNTTVNELKTLNNLNSNLININQKLIVPGSSYIVQKGDTLYGISKKFNTTVDNIKSKNNLKSNIINIGQVLLI
jgi:LysM repeat protein